MLQPRPTHPACSLAIAGIGVQIVCNEAQLGAALAQRYHAFASDAPPRLTAQIDHIGGDRTTPLFDPAMSFRDGVVQFATPGYRGRIDVARGQAQLALSTTYPLEEIEYFLRVAYALLVFDAGGLLFHAAGIVRGQRSYLFFGYSGSGKTTVARLSPRDRVLNDDLVLLMPHAGQWIAYATPFSNPTQVPPTGADCAPVAALLRLVQSKQVRVEPIGAGQALAELIANSPIIAADPSRSLKLFGRCQQLAQDVPVRRLHFLPDDSFWAVVESIHA